MAGARGRGRGPARGLLGPLALLGLLGLGALAGCVDAGHFKCATSVQCGPSGLCEPGGGCSFPDPSCSATGRRYGQFSELGGQCTGGDGGVGPDGGDAGPLTCTPALAVGGEHTCVKLGDTVQCWGNNDSGQLGDGTRLRRSLPRTVTGLPPVAAVSAGFFHTCAWTVAGEIWCWGDNDELQVADARRGAVTRPQLVSGLGNIQQLASGGRGSCVLEQSGAIKCWGANNFGQLGNGVPGAASTPVTVVDVPAAQSISVGGYLACAITRSGGQVWCWGENDAGQLGIGSLDVKARPQQTMMSGAVEIAVGESHVCARKLDGSVWCWGWNGLGQIGAGPGRGDNVLMPTQVRNVSGAVEIASGPNFSCAREGDGDVWCWGGDSYGQSGVGDTQYARDTPVRATQVDSALALGLGRDHACALRAGGQLACWGRGALGALGDGSTVQSSVPLELPGTSFTQLGAGSDATCGVDSAGAGQCWGLNGFGQLGLGDSTDRLKPTAITLASAAMPAQFAAGYWRTCARTTAGGAQCWGNNSDGALGNDETPPQTHDRPVVVVGVSGASHLAMGGGHACVRRGSDGAVLCWGQNASHQLGDGSTMPRAAAVASTVTGALDVVTGGDFTCARTASMGVTCWGDNSFGQLGDGSGMPRSAPVTVVAEAGGAALTGVVELVAGGGHACARTATQVLCWGVGYAGQLGDNMYGSANAARVVSGLTAMRVFAGGSRTCAIDMAGALKCWGDNFQGALGDGGFMPRAVPTQVMGLTSGVVDVAIGRGGHTCARTMDGKSWCWGENEYGQLGVGSGIGAGTSHTALSPRVVALSCP